MAVLTILSVSLFAQKAGKKDNTKHLTIYTCPMHDSIGKKKKIKRGDFVAAIFVQAQVSCGFAPVPTRQFGPQTPDITGMACGR